MLASGPPAVTFCSPWRKPIVTPMLKR